MHSQAKQDLSRRMKLFVVQEEMVFSIFSISRRNRAWREMIFLARVR